MPRAVALVAFIAAVVAASSAGARQAPSLLGAEPPRTQLYRLELLQAAPGQLVALIDLLKARVQVITAAGDDAPFVVRHSQGDHWDIAAIYPMGDWTSYFSKERSARRESAADASGVSTAEFSRRLSAAVTWHEDLYLYGPALATFRASVEGAGLAHFEMLQGLAGKRDELVREREMENVYNRERGRPPTVIFVRDRGAAWDVVTLDVYRNWRHYAEQETISRDTNEAAARKAGFQSADAIGPYMRTLISTHRDTLGPIIVGATGHAR